MNTYIVMPGGSNPHSTIYRFNAVDLTQDAAEAEAAHRNAQEAAAGRSRDEILWFPMMDFTKVDLV